MRHMTQPHSCRIPGSGGDFSPILAVSPTEPVFAARKSDTRSGGSVAVAGGLAKESPKTKPHKRQTPCTHVMDFHMNCNTFSGCKFSKVNDTVTLSSLMHSCRLLNHVYIYIYVLYLHIYIHIRIHIDIHIACIYIYIHVYNPIQTYEVYPFYSAANQLFFADCPQPLVCWHFRLVFNSQGHTYHNLIICHYAPYNSKTVNLNLCATPNNLRTNHSPIQSIRIGTNHYLEKQHIPRCRFLD